MMLHFKKYLPRSKRSLLYYVSAPHVSQAVVNSGNVFRSLYYIEHKIFMDRKPVLLDLRSFFCTIAGTVLVQARNPSQVAVELENALDEHRFEDAWKIYEKHIHMAGLPRKSILSKLITGFADSYDVIFLKKACEVVELVFEEKKYILLEKEPLIYLSCILAQCELPHLAANVVRRLVCMEMYPPVAAWSAVTGHMCQTATGAFIAADLIFEIGYLFKDNRIDPRKKCNRPLLLMKPNLLVFHIVLTGLLLCDTTKKAEQLIEFMPRVGVKPDARLLVIMARVYERNGHRDEVKKLKRHVDEASGLSYMEFQQFYDCLLSCHLKFRDWDAAASMVLDILRKARLAKQSVTAAKSVLEAAESRKLCFPPKVTRNIEPSVPSKSVSVDSRTLSFVKFAKDCKFSKLQALSSELLHLLYEKLKAHAELVESEGGILHPSEKLYAKLVRGFLEEGKINALATFLIKASKEDCPTSICSSVIVQVINACIDLGLLDQAHDLLDEMRFSNIRVGSTVYSSLLKAYCKDDRHEDITALLKDAQQAGIQLDPNCYEAVIQSKVHQNDSAGALHVFKEMRDSNIPKASHKEFGSLIQSSNDDAETGLVAKLLEEVKENLGVDHSLHDWNSMVHFFCRKRLMHDAQKTFSKMKALGHTPNAQTFHSLVVAYAAIGGKYVEVTDLWGEMKVLASVNSMKFDQELLDSLLYCFVRGGFFLRAMEVIEMMEKQKLFIDRYKYKLLWLKYHRKLYKGKAPKIQTEAQFERREAALSFRRWIGLT